MEQVNCIIIDDDPNSIQLIEQYLKDYKLINNVGSFKCPIKALESLPSLYPDLVFLDINMPGLSGIELINKLGENYNIILTTGSHEYAIESYEYNVIDYLLKPITRERFAKSIYKFKEKKGFNLSRQNIEIADRINKTNVLYIKQNYKTIQIPLSSILYLEGDKEYVKIFTTDSVFKTKQSMSHFEKRLGTFYFVRIHRSFIVSWEKISFYTSTEVRIANKKIPVGRSYQKYLKPAIQNIDGDYH